MVTEQVCQSQNSISALHFAPPDTFLLQRTPLESRVGIQAGNGDQEQERAPGGREGDAGVGN